MCQRPQTPTTEDQQTGNHPDNIPLNPTPNNRPKKEVVLHHPPDPEPPAEINPEPIPTKIVSHEKIRDGSTRFLVIFDNGARAARTGSAIPRRLIDEYYQRTYTTPHIPHSQLVRRRGRPSQRGLIIPATPFRHTAASLRRYASTQ